MGTFEALAFDVAAALVLCGLNALVSTPDDSIIKRIHLEIVSLETGLYGLMKLIKSLLSAPLSGWVRLRYSAKQVDTQSDKSAG